MLDNLQVRERKFGACGSLQNRNQECDTSKYHFERVWKSEIYKNSTKKACPMHFYDTTIPHGTPGEQNKISKPALGFFLTKTTGVSSLR